MMCLVSLSVFSQDEATKSKAKAESLTEVYLGPDASNTFRTGVVYKGVYVWGQVNECKRDYAFSAGVAYDNHIKNTSYRVMASYGKEFYGYIVAMQDLGIKHINLQPTLLIDSNLACSIGIYLPIQLTKNITLGFWGTKELKAANKGGFRLGENKLEVDLYFRF